MRKMKKLVSILLAMVMVLGMTCTAFAADSNTYTITVSNTTQGYVYAAYKIFDATVGTSGDQTTVAYSMTTDNPWFSIITDGYSADGNGVYTTECFVLTPTGTDTGYTVKVKDGVGDADITAYFNGQITMTENPAGSGTYTLTAPDGVTDVATASGTGSALTLDVSSAGAGYYFVTSTLGATVTITTTDPKASVIDKNTPVGNLNKEMISLDTSDDVHAGSSAMGDDVAFQVTANVPLYAPGNAASPEGYLVTDYEFDDEMTVGLEIRGLTEETDYTIGTDGKYYATESLINQWITLSEGEQTYQLTDVAYHVTLELLYPSYYENDGNDQIQFDGFTLKYNTISDEDMEKVKDNDEGKYYKNASEIETNYPVNARIVIDYSAHVTEDVDYENTNHIEMYWHVSPFLTPTTPQYGGHESDDDEIYVLEFDLTKVDGKDHKKLAGAEFQLEGKNLKEVVNNTTYQFSALTKDEYDEKKAAGTEELWFEVESGISFTGSEGYYTDVDPYVLLQYDPNADVSDYVVDSQVADYPYVAYTLRVSHNSSLQEAADSKVTGTTDENGKLTFIGLTVGTYTLTEIKAPDGYNLLPTELTFDITVSYDTTTGKPTFSLNDSSSDGFSINDGVVSITVENSAGSILPGTGGMGTTLFYIIGAILVCGAVVLLVSRRRMHSAE